MAGPKFWLLLLVGISVPAAFCNFNYHKYIDKYHKGTSTTETSLKPGIASTTAAVTASTPETSSSLKDIFPSTEDSSEISGDDALPVEGTQGDERHTVNGTILQGDPYYQVDVQYMFIMRIVIIVGSVIAFVVVLGCIVCCCPTCCRGNERRGFVIRDNRETAPLAHPQQPLVSQQPQQHPVLVQHFPPNYTQEQTQQFTAPYPQQLPPQYQQQQQYSPQYAPGQPDPQISPNAIQFYNPPEAPPPYEDMPSHKY